MLVADLAPKFARTFLAGIVPPPSNFVCMIFFSFFWYFAAVSARAAGGVPVGGRDPLRRGPRFQRRRRLGRRWGTVSCRALVRGLRFRVQGSGFRV